MDAVHTLHKLCLRLQNGILVIYEKHVIFRNCPNRLNSLNKIRKVNRKSTCFIPLYIQ